MSVERRGLRLYLGSLALAMVWAGLRYTLLARLLGPTQLGLAAIVIITAQFFDSVGDAGSDRFIVQDKSGGTEQVQRVIHLAYLVRGGVVSVILLVSAGLLARFYRAPALVPGLMLLAIYPLAIGFTHLDFRRLQRDHDFRSEGWAMAVSETIGFFVTGMVALLLHSYIASVWGLIARAVAWALVTQVCAQRRYSVGYDRVDAARLAAFGAPLMLSGLVMFFGGQGDRLVIARQLSIGELGLYQAVMLLAFYPSTVVSRFLSQIQFPQVANAKLDPHKFRALTDVIAGRATLAGLAMAAGFAVVTPLVLVPLYGSRFAQSVIVVAMIGVLQMLRFVRYWTMVVALGVGRSGPVLVTNLVRLVALPLAILLVALGLGLKGLILGFCLGEALAYLVATVLANTAADFPWWFNLDRVALFPIGCVVVVEAARSAQADHAGVRIPVLLASGILAIIVGLRERDTLVGLATSASTGLQRLRSRLSHGAT